MKQNDWIVASINNPEFSAGDFKFVADMTLNNTQLLSKDQYLKSSYILENDLFKNDNGQFSEKLFNDFYAASAQKFAEFSTENIIDNYEYSMWDTMRPTKGKVKDINFNLGIQQNPDHITIGVAGFNQIAEFGKSVRELAQDSKIFDPATGKYLDYSVNDISLWNNPIEYFKSLWDDPLVYATYDEDTEEIDPFTGNKVLHKKGEWKLNDQGEYYVEKLNGRSLIGKQVVSAGDYLTPENSIVNKYDFFDSDDVEKSVGGTIAKNIAAVLPMFIPYVNTVYAGLLVSREMSKSLPMLYGMAMGLSGSDNVDSKLLNTIAAYGHRMTGSTSDYAQQNTFAFENFGNLASDVALQWGQQRFIANTFSKLTNGGKGAIDAAYAKAQGEYLMRTQKGIGDVLSGKMPESKFVQYVGTSNISKLKEEMIETGKWLETPYGIAAKNKFLPTAQKIAERRMRMGQDMSLVYMAIVSNTDVYETVLEKGGTPFEAAAITLGSTIGMFSVDKYLGLGEMFFNSEPARRALREAARHNANLVMANAGIKATEAETKKGIMGLIQRGITAGKKAVADYHGAIKDRSLGFIGKSLGEGLEEVSEELVADVSKYIGELAGRLGYFSQTDYGAGENAFDRYAMSFLGGAVGGGIFYGVDVVQNRNNKSSQDFQNEITYLLRQGKKDEIFAELENLKKKGKLGSTDLSFNTTKDKDNNDIYITADENNESQADYVYRILKTTINQLDLILNENQLNLNEDQLFDRMVQGEYRALALTDFLKGNSIESTKEISYITRYQDDFQKLANDILNIESKIQQKLNTTLDKSKRTKEFDEELEKLKQEKEELIKQRDYLFGEGSLGYVEKMLFAMDTNLSGNFIALNYNQYVRHNAGKSVQDLTDAEKEYYSKAYENYTKTVKMGLDEAFKLFKEMQVEINPEIQSLSTQNLSKNIKEAKKIAELNPFNQYLTYDSKLEGESKKDFEERYIKRKNETDEQFEQRVKDRQAKIEQYNQDHLPEWIEQFSKIAVDKNTFRTLQAQLGLLRKTRYNSIIEGLSISGNVELQEKIWKILKTYGSDKKNRRKLYSELRKTIQDSVKQYIEETYKDRKDYLPFADIKQDLEAITGFYPEHALTKGDMYTWIKAWMDVQIKNGGNPTIEDAIAVLESYGFEFGEKVDDEEGILKTQAQTNTDFIDYYNRIEAGMTSVTDPEADDIIEINQDFIDTLIQEDSERIYDDLKKNSLQEVFKNLDTDQMLKSLTDLENISFIKNPVFAVLNKIRQKLRNSDVSIEQFLEEIYSQYTSGESATDFELSDSQMKTLSEFKRDLEMAKAFIYAASSKSSYGNPVGHNKSINEFVANHRNVFKNIEPLPEIDEQTANFLINELNGYSNEINSWIERSQRNTADKVKKFVQAEVAFNKARLDFYKINRNAFKLNPTLDLLDGYEDLTLDNSLASLVQVEELLHRNYKRYTKQGVTLKQILDGLFANGLVKIETLKNQRTAKLDEKIEYKHLTDYDKLAIVVSNFALSSVDFYTKLRDFIKGDKDIAPLAIQEYAARLNQAQQTNPKLINEVLDYINEKADLPVLKNTTIITGVAGSGKTRAVAKLSSVDGADTWLSGPTDSQTKQLLEALPKGTVQSKEQLLELILGEKEYGEFVSSISNKSGKWKTNGNYVTKATGLNGDSTVKLNDSVKISKITNAPKMLIIDEATHFSTAELLLISKFAEENNIDLILLGDETQNGDTHPGLMYNLGREEVLAWRTPKLFISLRDNNIQKIKNLASCISIMDQLDAVTSEEEQANLTKKLLDDEFKNLTFRYFNGDQFFGELITDDLSNDLIQKLSGDIGFIGDESSPFYKQLQDAGKNPTRVNPLQVQGREFDYVIVDRDWKLDINTDNLAQTGANIFTFMQELYTMISRSKKGTILIDKGLSKFVANVEDEFTGVSSAIKNAVETFRNNRLQQIEQALSKITPEEVTLETKKEEKPPVVPDDKIKGTDVKVEDLKEETEPEEKETDKREQDKKESKDEEEKSYLNPTTPIRVYSNVSYSGIKINKRKKKWTNEDDVTKDLGIFLRKGQSISEGEDKYKLIRKLIELKCIFNYGITSDTVSRLHPDIKSILGSTDDEVRENIANAEYYISVQDADDSNRLVGLTDSEHPSLKNFKGLRNEKRDIVNGKVLSLVAKFKGKDGKTYEITLGGLANPKTWRDNEGKIRTAIQAKIDSGASNSTELTQYLADLGSNITAYENRIAELSKNNQEQRINKPEFSGLTTLVEAGMDLRLEEVNSKFSPFNEVTGYSVKSKIYTIVNDIPGVKMTYTDSKGRERTLKGKAVMYVSSNILLNPDELESLYMAQKQDPSIVPQVRMIVLDNKGVSFQSLYRKSYQDLYNIKKGSVLRTTPFELMPMSIRMYIAAWNFRANLKSFLKIYNKWLSDSKTLDNQTIEALCKIDNDEYNRIKGDQEYLNEEDYRSQVSDELKAKLKPIWDFNDSLAGSVRQFRLGYNATNGAYIRKLTNLKEDGFYEDVNNTLGIYINPTMATQFDGMLDALFENIIDKIIPPSITSKEFLPYIDTELAKGWFEKVELTKDITVKMYDDEGNLLNADLNISKEDALTALPIILIETAKFLQVRSFDPESFDEYLDDPDTHDTKYSIKFGDEILDWRSIASALEGGQKQQIEDLAYDQSKYGPGFQPFTDSEGITWVLDKRIDNMFNLMFHGMTSTSVENDFTKGDIRATDAAFKFGFFVDPITESPDGKERSNAVTLTNRKFFSSDVVPGLPIIGISLEQYQESTTETKSVTPTPSIDEDLDLINAKNFVFRILDDSGIKLSPETLNRIKSMDELYDLVNSKIQSKFVQYLNSQKTSSLDKLIIGVERTTNGFKFIYFPESPELNGETIRPPERVNKVLTITTDQGHTYEVRTNGDAINWVEVGKANNEDRTVGGVIQQINEVISKLSDFLTDKEFNVIQKIISEQFKNDNLSTIASDKLIAKAIDAIQQHLNRELRDESDEKWTLALDKAIKDLSNLKNSKCNL